MAAEQSSGAVSKGVEELIRQLRDDGVAAGRGEAERIVHEAEQKARSIRKKAEQEAEELVQKARADAEDLQRSGEEALKVAVRDAVLRLTETIERRFKVHVEGQVQEALEQQEVIQRMVVEVAGRVRDSVQAADRVEVLLPPQALDLDALRKDTAELEEGTLTHFVRAVAQDVLRDGVTLRPGSDDMPGIVIQLDDGSVRVELDPRTVTAVVLEHLQPRFRAWLQGIVT